MKWVSSIVLLMLYLCSPSPGWAAAAATEETIERVNRQVQSAIRYHWRDAFTDREQARLKRWVADYVVALESLVGVFPFTLHVDLHRYEGGTGPVPWAQTRRGRRQGVILYVNPRLPDRELRADWTAPHELSHLIIPYVGRKNSWFAEGFASYMQYQVMMAAGTLSAAQARENYLERFARAEGRYDLDDMPFSMAGPKLREQRRYPTMYWGGAVFFWQVERALAQQGTSLTAVLSEYMACCRRNSSSVERLVRDLDRIAGMETFQSTLDSFRSRRGFPDYRG